ncbi:fungal-specific transcription factor domain-containing protein [Mycena olivaceomarginata]|nr:fungal-specific transcription factor domain-containing protein [Mycena olivaceomarginata]
MPKGPALPKVRGPYTTQACTVCRAKKAKCDGAKPVCGYCAASARDDECSWGKDDKPRQKTRTEAHFEALRKRVDSLQAYVDLLEGILAKCVCQDISSHLRVRPQPPEEQRGKEQNNSGPEDSDEEIILELTAPMQRLKLDDRLGGLLLHGTTAPFRFCGPSICPLYNKVSLIPVVNDPNASYVLQLDNVDTSQTHPVDWSRHLPPEVALDRKEHDKILDLCFTFFTMWSFRVVPSLFLRDMYRALSTPRSEAPPITPHYSPMLHNAILSLAAVYSDNPGIRDSETRQHFANAAKAYLEVDCKKPNLSLMHALTFLGSFYTNEGDRIQAEMFIGMSKSIGTILGLCIDSTPWVKAGLITQEERIARNWAYWTMFSLEISWALYYGRDFNGPRHNINGRKVPIPLVDSEMDKFPWYHGPANIPPQPNFLTLILFQSSALFVIVTEIIDVVNGLCPAMPPNVKQLNAQILKINVQLYNWKSGLPLQLDITPANRVRSTPQRLVLHLVYWWCFIILHRPFFNRPAQPGPEGGVDHVKLCTRAAENILELLETWQSLYTLRLVPITIVQIVFSAGTATEGMRIAQGALKTAVAHAEQCIGYLYEAGASWTAAKRTGDILLAIMTNRLMPIIARRLAQKNEQTTSAATASSSSSLLSEMSALSGAGAPKGPSVLPVAARNPELVTPNWTQPPLNPFAQTQSPSATFDAECLSPFGAFANVDMTALLPNIHYFGAHELLGLGVGGDAGSARFSLPEGL